MVNEAPRSFAGARCRRHPGGGKRSQHAHALEINSWGAGGQVQVSAYGLEDADYCKVGGWGTGGTDFFVNVGCYDGNPSDQRFDMLFVC